MVKKTFQKIKFQKKLLISLIIFVFFLFLSIQVLYSAIKFSRKILITNNYDYLTIKDPNLYIINTTGCSIPKTPVMPQYFRNEWLVEYIPDCHYETKNFIMAEDEELVTFNPRVPHEKCCLHEILSTSHNESYSFSKCETSHDDTINVKEKAMFVVKCNSSINVEATFPISRHVQEKLNYWESRKDESKSPNILIIGIDSVSRLHARRSLPKTLKLLKKMNFYEFKGYHSAGPSTLENVLPMLMGLSLNDVRSQCAPDWQSNFDDCPFIWNYLDSLHYITSFVEDGEGSFNWGGLGGYSSKPTDFYIRPLFQALKHLRLKSFGPNTTFWTEQMFTDCTSSETVPEFVLRYTQRFIQKFKDVAPFFKFTWLAYPFHEKIFSLGSLDEKLYEFFENLNDDASTSLLENTLVILISDHGDRTSFFQSSSTEGFFERSLPMFYLRLPHIFEQKFPYHSARVNLLKNTKRLTTPWDIYQTLVETVQLFTSTNSQHEKSTQKTDRSTLYLPVPLERNCDTVNISPKNCVCNTIRSDIIPTKSTLKKKLLRFLSRQLNKISQNSKYVQICSKWFTKLVSIRIIETTHNSTNYLVVFSASSQQRNFEDAIFEGRLGVSNDLEIPSGIKLIGSLTRINSYGNQTYCIPQNSDFDKEMRQYCVCKLPTKRLIN